MRLDRTIWPASTACFLDDELNAACELADLGVATLQALNHRLAWAHYHLPGAARATEMRAFRGMA